MDEDELLKNLTPVQEMLYLALVEGMNHEGEPDDKHRRIFVDRAVELSKEAAPDAESLDTDIELYGDGENGDPWELAKGLRNNWIGNPEK